MPVRYNSGAGNHFEISTPKNICDDRVQKWSDECFQIIQINISTSEIPSRNVFTANEHNQIITLNLWEEKNTKKDIWGKNYYSKLHSCVMHQERNSIEKLAHCIFSNCILHLRSKIQQNNLSLKIIYQNSEIGTVKFDC